MGTLAVTHSGTALAEPASTPVSPAAGAAADDASTPSKEAVRKAGEHYARALSLYSESDFALAIIEFERAYSLVSDYRVLYNIGQVRAQLSNYAKARTALEQYLREGGDKVSPERRKAVAADLEMLAARTATLAVKVNVEGALISVDDVEVGTSPLKDILLLDAGDHRLKARKQGFNAAEGRVTLAGRDAGNASLELTPEAHALAPRVIVEKQYIEKTDRKTWIWVTWSATGVFALSSAALGGMGLKAANELDEMRASDQTTRGELDSAQRRARTLLVTADVLGGAAIVTGGIALYLTLSNRTESPAAKAQRERRPHADVAILPNWIGVSGSF